MKSCYLCDSEFTTKNKSKEHILLNSIGGHLKSKSLLCKKCNSELGHNADTELSNQLSFLANFLQVKRDKGKNQIIKGGKTKEGKEYHIKDGGKPILAKPKFKKYQEDNETKYSISARNEKELLEILKGLKKKHPELDLEEVKQKFQSKKYYLNEPLSYNTTIGGETAFKSIVKTAVNFYILTQREKRQVQHLFDYLQDKEKLTICKHFYPKKPIYKKESGEIIHLIHLVGVKHSKILYCFIEFFSSYSFLVKLSDNYIGNSFKQTYAYDLNKNCEVNKSVNLKLTKERLNEILNLSKDDFQTITERLKRVLRIAEKRQTDREISNMTKRATEEIFNKRFKHEKIITEEMINEYSKYIATEYTKFVFRNKKRNNSFE